MVNNIFLSSSEFSCNVWLDMNNNIITNLSAPVNPSDGVNKAYVDATVSSNLNAFFIKITTIPGLTATNVQEALSELNKDMNDCLPLSGGQMTGSINMNNNSITDLSTPTEVQTGNAANVQYVNTYVDDHVKSIVQPAITKIQQDITTTTNSMTSLENSLKDYLPLIGGKMTGDLQMDNHTVTGLTTPSDTDTTNAANVQYVNTYVTTTTSSLTPLIHTNTENIAACNQKISSLESSLNSYLPLIGGKMTGDLQMDNHTVTGLTTPQSSELTKAANVEYVNNIFDTIQFSPFYTAIQLDPPTITTTPSPWINPTGENNSFMSNSNSTSFFNFDSSYVKLYLMRQGLYLFTFSCIGPPPSFSSTLNIYFTNTSNTTQIITFVNYTLYGGGFASAIIPVVSSPSEDQCYLTISCAQDGVEKVASNFSLIWLPAV